MMGDLNEVYWAGTSCSGNTNGTVVASTYDGDPGTWSTGDNCRLGSTYKHNWYLDYCTYLYDGGAGHDESVYSTGNESANLTAVSKLVITRLYPATDKPYVKTGTNEIAITRWTAGTDWINEWACYGTSAEYIIYPVANFTGSPLSGPAGVTISFTDTSTNDPTEWNWSATGNGTVFFSDPGSKDTTAIFPTPGNYTITHGVSNAQGSDLEVKTDYIYIYDSNTLVDTGFLATDATNGMRINGAQVDLEDIENASWKNTTTTMGLGIIQTFSGHTINAYGSAGGYEDADLLAQPAMDQKIYSLLMWPDNMFTNASEGYISLYIHVKDYDTLVGIPDAHITGGGQNYGVMVNSSAFGLTTNAAGIASIQVRNNTNIYLTVSKNGYSPATQVVATGTGSGGTASKSVTILLGKGTVTVAPTATTYPGQPGVFPTTVTTIDPNDPALNDGDTSLKAQEMMNWLAMNGMDLVQLCFLVTVMALLGVKFGK